MAKKKGSAGNPWPKKLKAFRDSLGITQEQAAERLGVTRRAWIKWETDGEVPSRPYASLLSQFIKHPEDFPAKS